MSTNTSTDPVLSGTTTPAETDDDCSVPARTNANSLPMPTRASSSASTSPNSSLSRTVAVPGHTYKIVSVPNRHVLTLLYGQILLMPPNSKTHGSNYWTCTSKVGLVGFRNPVSGKFLGCGHISSRRLVCENPHQDSGVGFVLLYVDRGCRIMTMDYTNLCPIQIEDVLRPDPNKVGGSAEEESEDSGVPVIYTTKFDDKGVVWEFIEV